VSENHLSTVLPATEAGVPSASDKAGRFPFSAVSSAVLVVATGLGMVACGGSGGGGGGSTSPASVNVAGQAIKGPVSGGQVCAYTLSSPRQQIACTTTDANANYQLQLPAGTGEVLLEVSGGSYIDEATGQKVALTTPLRTLTKAGGPIENVLMTPFTELAVQRATVGNPGGNLTLVGFQTQIGALETGLGITGLATGNPFGGKSSADITHQKALEAFSKQQATVGKDVQGTLLLLGNEIDKCGIGGMGTTLAIYGAVGATTNAGSGGSVMLKAASTSVPEFVVTGDTVNLDTNLPNPCVDGVNIDGDIQPLIVLSKTSPPTSWLTAKSVEITQCTGSPSGNWNFPQAKVVIHAQSLSFTGDVTITSAGSYSIGGIGAKVQPIDLNQSGISLNTATGCLRVTGINGVGDLSTFAGVSIVSSTAGSGGGGLGSGGTIGSGGNIIISGGTGSSGGGSIVVSGGGLTTNGSGSSGSGGITLGKAN
jgi:hypothetical protein